MRLITTYKPGRTRCILARARGSCCPACFQVGDLLETTGMQDGETPIVNGGIVLCFFSFQSYVCRSVRRSFTIKDSLALFVALFRCSFCFCIW